MLFPEDDRLMHDPTDDDRGPRPSPGLPKAPTGIQGLDEITGGGLPRGRPTLVCGGAGCGKTVLAAEFLARGATQFGEPGLFVSFEETADELAANLRSLGVDLPALGAEGRLAVETIRLDRHATETTGEYDLEALLLRLGRAVDRIGARRIVLDTPEALFAALPDSRHLRGELQRLFDWIKARRLTAVVTAERDPVSPGAAEPLTRHGLEEYVADCVIVLDHRIVEQVSTRRLRVVKYRGSPHGTNEYPFLIGPGGLSVLPITSLRLDHEAPTARVSTGVPMIDEMLGGPGVYRGSSVLVSGSPGTGKSSVAASMAAAACARGERALFFSFEESRHQLVRNMRSVGIELERWERAGLLEIHATRPSVHGLEQHLLAIHERVRTWEPSVVVIDPISNLSPSRQDPTLKPTLMRLFDFLEHRGVTALFTSLVPDRGLGGNPAGDGTSWIDHDLQVSSLMDTWLVLADRVQAGERVRSMQVGKARGIRHSSQVRPFVIGDHGLAPAAAAVTTSLD